jgi:hypothetical protein
VSFSTYLRNHFQAVHGPWAYGICAGIVIAPILSVLKPRIGLPGIGAALLLTLAFGCALGVLYFLTRVIAWYIVRSREENPDARSWVGAGIWFCLWLCPALVIVLITETFAPPHGWLAEFLPPLQEDQRRWFASSSEPAVHESAGPVGETSTGSIDLSSAETDNGAEFLPVVEASPSELDGQEQENPFQLESDSSTGERKGRVIESPSSEENPFQAESEVEERPTDGSSGVIGEASDSSPFKKE